MHSRMSRRDRDRAADREDRGLDADVATRLLGFRWVEWNHARLGGAPIDETGAFLVPPDDPLDHLYVAASHATPRRSDAYARVPRFSSSTADAFVAARAARLFDAGRAVLYRREAVWCVDIPASGARFEGRALPAVLVRAALAWAAASELQREHR